MISIRDIAKECGVSVATVSKALNGHHDISAQTRETVCRKAAEMGYQPNSAARALKTNRTYNLGVLYEDPQHSGLGHEYFSRILESFRAQAAAERKKQAREAEKTAVRVTAEDIAAVVSGWTGIPVTRMTEDEGERLTALRQAAAKHWNVAQTEQYVERRLAALQTAPPAGRRTYIIKDVRLFLNSVDRGLRLIRDAGVDARTEREETEDEIVLTLRIPKQRRKEA